MSIELLVEQILKPMPRPGKINYTIVLVICFILGSKSLSYAGDTCKIELPDLSIVLCSETPCYQIQEYAGYADYVWSNGQNTPSVTICEPGTLSLTVTDAMGCTGKAIVQISDVPYTETINLSFCTGEYIIYKGIFIDVSGTFLDTIPHPLTLCPDTVYVVNVHENALTTIVYDVSYCFGDPYIPVIPLCDSVLPMWTCTLPGYGDECDTVVVVNVTEDPLEFSAVELQHCPGDSVFYSGQWYAGSGVFLDTVPSQTEGCDTVMTITVTESTEITIPGNLSMCDGDSVQFNGDWYFEEGLFIVNEVVSKTCSIEYRITVNTLPDFSYVVTPDLTSASGGVHFTPENFQYDWSDGYTGPVRSRLDRGMYTITVTDTNGCQIAETVLIPGPFDVVDDIGSDDDIEIYPNPSGGSFWIGLPDGQSLIGGVASVYGPGGNVVWNKEIPGTSTIQVDIDVPSGTYGLVLTDRFGHAVHSKMISISARD